MIQLLILLLSCPAQATVCVKETRVVLRRQPSMKSGPSWVVGRYMPLEPVKKEGAWLQVTDLDGETHWVPREAVSASDRCVAVRSSYSYLFEGPGYQYPKAAIQIADRYTPFKQISAQGEWLQVMDGWGHQSWINQKNVWRAEL